MRSREQIWKSDDVTLVLWIPAAKLSVSWVELFLRSPRFPEERPLSLSLSIFTFHIVPLNTKMRNMKGT